MAYNSEVYKRYYQKNRLQLIEKRKIGNRKRLYNITDEQYNNKLKEQNDCCDVCKKHKSEFNYNLCVDHNHTTNEIRGLLCYNCNSAYGRLNEDINIMYNLINYAKKYNKKDN